MKHPLGIGQAMYSNNAILVLKAQVIGRQSPTVSPVLAFQGDVRPSTSKKTDY